MPDAAETEYAALLDRARADPSVVGVVVYGSRAAGPFVTPESDVDCIVIVDGSIDVARRWRTPHGAPVEVWPMTIDAFRVHALPGDAFAWNRPALIRARVDLDKLGGEIGRIVDRKRRLRDDEAREAAAFELDGAINSLHRALRSAENGRDLAARLDAQEAIGPLLRFASRRRAESGRSTSGSSTSWRRSRSRRPRSPSSRQTWTRSPRLPRSIGCGRRSGCSRPSPARPVMPMSSTAGSRTWPGSGARHPTGHSPKVGFPASGARRTIGAMTARSLPRPARGSWVSPRWAAAFAEGAALLTVLCGLIIAAALLSRPA